MKSEELFFIGLLMIITIMTSLDLIADYREGTDAWHLLLEALLVLVSMGAIGFLVRAYWQRLKELELVKQQLSQTHESLSKSRELLDESREQLRVAGQEYQSVIQKQFDTWQLTPSEKEVAALLLKGLSFEEMATVRNTKEKTVRQQATSIYRKANVTGRHEFAAWFFEDFLQ